MLPQANRWTDYWRQYAVVKTFTFVTRKLTCTVRWYQDWSYRCDCPMWEEEGTCQHVFDVSKPRRVVIDMQAVDRGQPHWLRRVK